MFYNYITCRYVCFVRIEILTFFKKLGADSTDPVDTTRTSTVIYAYDANCYELLRIDTYDLSVASVASVCDSVTVL